MSARRRSIIYSGAKPTIVYTDNGGQNTAATTHTFSGRNIGTADPTRFIIVGVGTFGGNAISGCTINGVSATLLATSGGSGTNAFARFYGLSVASGTTATIVVSLTTSQTAFIGVFAAYHLLSTTPTDTAGDNSSNPLGLSLNVQSNGIACGYALTNATPLASWSWTGMTEQFDAEVPTGSNIRHSGATYSATAAQTPLSVTASYAGAGLRAGCAIALR